MHEVPENQLIIAIGVHHTAVKFSIDLLLVENLNNNEKNVFVSIQIFSMCAQ